MFGSVKARPNHYETLGLTPSATGDDIAKAFATRMQIQITGPEEADDHALKLFAAYETLRDPFSRQIYNAELGLAPEPRHPESAVEHRVAPFIAAALRDPIERTEHATSPDFILLPDTEDPESPVEQSGEPLIAGHSPSHSTEGEASVPDVRERRSEWNRAGAGTGAVVLGLGLLTLLGGLLWGNVDTQPTAFRGSTASGPERIAPRVGEVAQPASQPAVPIEVEPAQLPAEPVSTEFAPVTLGDIGLVPKNSSSTMSSAAAAETTNEAEETQIAEQSSGTTASSTDALAPALASTETEAADPLAPAPAAVSQTAPTAVAQVVASAPAARPTAVVNRTAPARLISGNLVKADNPRGQFRGTVTVRFTVQPNGQISGCRAAVSSGSSALDARTCRLVEQRLRFSPALDSQGRAVPSESRASYTWGVKRRPLLDQLLKLVRR